MKLDKEAARRGVDEKIAKPLGVSFIQATWGIHDLINETMAAAAKTHIAEKGGNPKIVTIVAFGGAGPVHAYGLCKKLGAPRLLVPPNAGVGSALGFFTAPRAFDLLRSHKVPLGLRILMRLKRSFKELEAEAINILKERGHRERYQDRAIPGYAFYRSGIGDQYPARRKRLHKDEKGWNPATL